MTKIGLLLSLVFGVLKLLEITVVASWSWFQVLIPIGIGLGIDLIFIATTLILTAIVAARKAHK